MYLTFTFVFIKLMNTLGQMRKNGLEAIVASSMVPTAFTLAFTLRSFHIIFIAVNVMNSNIDTNMHCVSDKS